MQFLDDNLMGMLLKTVLKEAKVEQNIHVETALWTFN